MGRGMSGSSAFSSSLRFGLLAIAAGAAAGLGFALWAEQSAGIFLAMVDSGLSWCF